MGTSFPHVAAAFFSDAGVAVAEIVHLTGSVESSVGLGLVDAVGTRCRVTKWYFSFALHVVSVCVLSLRACLLTLTDGVLPGGDPTSS